MYARLDFWSYGYYHTAGNTDFLFVCVVSTTKPRTRNMKKLYLIITSFPNFPTFLLIFYIINPVFIFGTEACGFPVNLLSVPVCQSVSQAVMVLTASRSVSVRMEASVTGRLDSVCVDQAGSDSAARKVGTETTASWFRYLTVA